MLRLLGLAHREPPETGMGSLIKAYAVLFVRSWNPDYDGTVSGVSPRRWLVMAGFWPLFLLVQTVNGLGLLLDHLLFPDFRRVRVREPLFVVGVRAAAPPSCTGCWPPTTNASPPPPCGS